MSKLPKALEARMNELINDAPKNASHEIGREQGFRAAASILLEGGDALAEALKEVMAEAEYPEQEDVRLKYDVVQLSKVTQKSCWDGLASWNKLKEGGE